MWHALILRVAPSLEHRATLIYLSERKKVDYIFDVGANKGQFALAASIFFPEIFLIAFEPLKSEYEIFNKIFKNKHLYKNVPKALGSENKKVEINLTKRLDSSSILKPSNELFKTFGESSSNYKTIIKMITLNDFFIKSNLNFKNGLLKIDVQGFELEVLKGSTKVINKFKYIIIELSNIELYENQPLASEVFEFIIQNNFEHTFTYNKFLKNQKDIIQADYLFTRI